MRKMALSLSVLLLMLLWRLDLASCHQHFSPASESHDHHHCSHHHHHGDPKVSEPKLPEEIAEEEDLKLYGFGSHDDHHHHHDHHHHDHHHDHHFGKSELSGLELWVNALGCSFLVSMASLICLIILPLIFVQGKPSRAVVDSLALFGAGAMLGDAFLHQLPHAFGGEHSHSHDHDVDNHEHSHSGGHAHSLKDLSIGISVLAGIVLFLLVEKLVRYVEDNSRGANTWSHGHHHHHSKKTERLDGSENAKDNNQSQSDNGDKVNSEKSTDKKELQKVIDESSGGNNTGQSKSLRKRKNTKGSADVDSDEAVVDDASKSTVSSEEKEQFHPPSNLVFGYLNLFSDGVHNFTDGMALGSAFLLYGSVGGWSRTLFLLAHELPQEVGDFGILVRSGFSVSKALFFNFLSALVALAGTALALIWGQDPGQSSLIEGFTAGGFIYIAVAGVLAEMNNNGNSSSIKTAVAHLVSLTLGMAVALCISLVE